MTAGSARAAPTVRKFLDEPLERRQVAERFAQLVLRHSVDQCMHPSFVVCRVQVFQQPVQLGLDCVSSEGVNQLVNLIASIHGTGEADPVPGFL
jgi:hypothetical protein